ncbi:SDR family NAD(P)-dependent oxidoreductase [Candidatus Pacearchaeota archaeon]|nr:SDR family NAD(P)-dependent oxidoreductase [Candidatus Pacearchaeota archaeon]
MDINLKKVYEGKNVLVTGGAGFIGSNLVHRLVGLGAKVAVVDALIPGLGGREENLKGLENKIFFRREDIADKDFISDILSYLNPKFIFNVAGSIKHSSKTEEDDSFDNRINYVSHLHFLRVLREFLIRHSKPVSLIYAGTRDQYGRIPAEKLPVTEEFHAFDFPDNQSISKQAAENHHSRLTSLVQSAGVPISVASLRLVNTYGPRQNLNCGAVVPTYIKKALENEELEVWGGGNILRDINYVDDVVDAILLTGATDNSAFTAYNLGCFLPGYHKNPLEADSICTIKQLANQIVQIIGRGSVVEREYPAGRKAIEPGNCYSDISKIYKEIGWRPKVSLEEGLKRTKEFLQNQCVSR